MRNNVVKNAKTENEPNFYHCPEMHTKQPSATPTPIPLLYSVGICRTITVIIVGGGRCKETYVVTSEELKQAILDALDLPIILLDRDLRLLSLNHAAKEVCRQYGLDDEAIVGLAETDAFPFIPQESLALQRQMVTSGSPQGDEWATDIRGTKLNLEIKRYPIFSGKLVSHLLITFRDIGKQRDLEASLRHTENLARALMDASTESMFLLASDGSIALANEVGAARLGRTTENIKGATGAELFPPEVWKHREPYLRRVLEKGEPVRFVDVRSGMTIDMSMVPILNSAGKTAQIAIFAHDITDRESTLAALKESDERFRGLFRNMPVPTYVWKQTGDDFTLDDANAAADDIAKGKIATLIGKKATEILAGRHDILTDMHNVAAARGTLRRDLFYTYILTKTERFLQASLAFVPPDYILMHTVDITAQKQAQEILLQASNELKAEVERRTRELAELNYELKVEREALRQKNIALQEVIEQASRSKDVVAHQIQSNIERIVIPVLDRLDHRLEEGDRQYLTLARSSLLDIVSPFLHTLQSQYHQLTPSEIEICDLIQKGYSSKEISRQRNTSVQTIIKQRKTIRRKLDISGKDTNLVTFLNSLVRERGSMSTGKS